MLEFELSRSRGTGAWGRRSIAGLRLIAAGRRGPEEGQLALRQRTQALLFMTDSPTPTKGGLIRDVLRNLPIAAQPTATWSAMSY
jgi:hypothetical protein